ncbi:phage virion morphogenesis protein [Sulfuriferula multivorans]|uniref:Phage virion morphogenesis protein n=1 Tax=Sulfuriferula multivorans TaxID=1559896 RepID=A0A401JF99_9PROT|nr:phage virion morphogenesis protein [Sulfuriferula multivorans]GBL46273.1 phage virion morphogenesis protein [Sulfuriferula multivorans]
MITIIADDKAVIEALNQLRARTSHMLPLMQDIGELLSETTKRRFDTSTAPDGTRWAVNSEVTILRYLGDNKGSYTKAGNLSKAGKQRSGSKRPLIGLTGTLQSTIDYDAQNDSVVIGSPKKYAATQHFGAKKHEFKGVAPWGDIPARTIFGVSSSDHNSLLELINEYLDPAS